MGLDPYIGLLHTIVYSRPALPLDLVEEFRPIVVDSIVLWLVNTRRVTAAHFVRAPQGPGIYLGEEAKRRFLAKYEQRLDTRVIYPATAERVTYRRCIELQARHLARVLLDRDGEYAPFLTK